MLPLVVGGRWRLYGSGFFGLAPGVRPLGAWDGVLELLPLDRCVTERSSVRRDKKYPPCQICSLENLAMVGIELQAIDILVSTTLHTLSTWRAATGNNDFH